MLDLFTTFISVICIISIFRRLFSYNIKKRFIFGCITTGTSYIKVILTYISLNSLVSTITLFLAIFTFSISSIIGFYELLLLNKSNIKNNDNEEYQDKD